MFRKIFYIKVIYNSLGQGVSITIWRTNFTKRYYKYTPKNSAMIMDITGYDNKWLSRFYDDCAIFSYEGDRY